MLAHADEMSTESGTNRDDKVRGSSGGPRAADPGAPGSAVTPAS